MWVSWRHTAAGVGPGEVLEIRTGVQDPEVLEIRTGPQDPEVPPAYGRRTSGEASEPLRRRVVGEPAYSGRTAGVLGRIGLLGGTRAGSQQSRTVPAHDQHANVLVSGLVGHIGDHSELAQSRKRSSSSRVRPAALDAGESAGQSPIGQYRGPGGVRLCQEPVAQVPGQCRHTIGELELPAVGRPDACYLGSRRRPARKCWSEARRRRRSYGSDAIARAGELR